jgi:hypothetical protein
MTKVKLSPFIDEISGMMGNVVFRRTKVKGEAILQKRPSKTKKPSKAQQAVWDRMKPAQAYATAVLADPKLRAYYERQAKKRKMQPRYAAISDYLQGKDLLTK